MRAGTLRERITLQASLPTTDPQWGRVDAWQIVDNLSASVIARAGSEGVKDSGVAAVTTYDVVIRYRGNVTSANRIVWRGKTLEIVSAIDPDGRKRQLNIEAKTTT